MPKGFWRRQRWRQGLSAAHSDRMGFYRHKKSLDEGSQKRILTDLSFLSKGPHSTVSSYPVFLTLLPSSGRVHWTKADCWDHNNKGYTAEVIQNDRMKCHVPNPSGAWSWKPTRAVPILEPTWDMWLQSPNHPRFSWTASINHQHIPVYVPPSEFFPAGTKTSQSKDQPF